MYHHLLSFPLAPIPSGQHSKPGVTVLTLGFVSALPF